jgi:predicted transcriptional regulator
MSKRLMEIAADIVQGQVSRTPMSTEEIVSSLKSVFSALMILNQDMGLDVVGSGEEAAHAGTFPETRAPKDSIQADKIVCLECGSEMRQLTAKHLGMHGLSSREYKRKWGFPMAQPLAAKSLTKARSKAAKKRGLPEKLRAYLDTRKKIKDTAAASAALQAVPEVMAEQKVVRRRKRTTTA